MRMSLRALKRGIDDREPPLKFLRTVINSYARRDFEILTRDRGMFAIERD